MKRSAGVALAFLFAPSTALAAEPPSDSVLAELPFVENTGGGGIPGSAGG